MRRKLLAFLFLIAAAQRSFVEPSPILKGRENAEGLIHNGERSFENSPGTHQYDFAAREAAGSLDEEVKELERLKPSLKQSQPHDQDLPPLSLSVMKTHSSVFSNINGKQEGKAETKQEVNKNGQIYAKIHQKIESKHLDNSVPPETNIITAVDIPGRNIHKIYRQHQPENNNNIFSVLNIPEQLQTKRNVDYSILDQSPSVRISSANQNNVQTSPKDLAEYVFWTGDEKSVTSAIEDYMQAGLMSREEAIGLLEDIKIYLGDIQDHYEHEKLKHQLKFYRSNEIPQAGLGNFQLNNIKRNSGAADIDSSEFNQIRQQLLKSNFNKRTSNQLISSLSQSKYPTKSKPSENLFENFSDEDYEELMEKLKMADLLYTENSLEDIIYQLAKVMFSQSLSHGNSEAQDALQKFTTFLENEVEQGRITRSLEKKVIDVLIASLTDTLNDHPEFLSAARGDNVQSRLPSYNVIPESPLTSNNEGGFRRTMFKPAMKKRNIQSSGILDGNVSASKKSSRK